ncbi:MAG: hypothetical protein JSS69_09040 [Acidobacteria bacterium]|nr:hypothetical protein [Acidobacteriota bacterium]
MVRQENKTTGKWKGLVCLFAVLLLQAPFARAAWISSAMACCMGDQCPVPSHHHKSHPKQTQQNDMPMDCGHDTSKMSDCKMSCCKTSDETAINIEQFVMPDLQIAMEPPAPVPQVGLFAPQSISRSEKPQSPPPKPLSL